MPFEPLTSSYGSQPAPSSGGGGGFSIFGWHPSLPNLGGFTAIKQGVSGILGLPEMATHLGGDVLSGQWGDLNPYSQDTTMGKLATGLGQSVENLATTGSSVVGLPFTHYNLGDEVVAPALQGLNESIFPAAHNPNTGEELPAYKPSSWSQRPGGPIVGLLGDVSTAAMIAAPIASGLGASAATAESTSLSAAAEAARAVGTADEASTAAVAEAAAERAAQAARYAQIAKNVAHPYQYLGARAADVVMGARDAAYPSAFNVPEGPQTAAQVLERKANGEPVDGEKLGNAIVSAVAPEHMTPEMAAATNVEGAAAPGHAAQAATTEPTDLQAASDAAAAHAAAQTPQAPPVEPGEPTTTLYRGDNPKNTANAGEAGDAGRWFTDNPDIARKLYAGKDGKVYKVEVPNRVLDEVRAEGGDSYGGIHDGPTQANQYKLPEDYRGTGTEHVPGSSKVADELAPEQAAARENIRQSHVAQQLAIRLATPAPEWAQRLTQRLPTPVNRIIASFATPISHQRVANLARDYARIVEVSQHEAQSSPAVLAMQQAAAVALQDVPTAERWDLSHIVGEEVAKVATGSKVVEQSIKDGMDPEVTAALKLTADNNYQGLPPELEAQMTDEQKVAFHDQVNAAAAAMQGLAEQHRQTLLASRPGMQGIERALMGDTSIPMSTSELKIYRQALQEERRSRILQLRSDDAERARVADVARQQLIGDKQSAEAARLTDQIGVLERSLETLHDPPALGLRVERIDNTVQSILREALYGGTTYDVGRDITNLPPDGTFVTISHQADIVVDPANLDAAAAQLKDVLQHPVKPDGSEYGQVFAGPDARLQVTPHTDPTTGQITLSVDIGMGTWGGRGLPQWLATGLGEMYKAPEVLNAATGESIPLSGQEAVQNLWAHYMGMALDPKSAISVFAESLRKTAETAGMPAENVDAMMRYYMMLDYSMSRATAGEWQLGDLFKGGKFDTGEQIPRGPYRPQTVLGLTTKEAIDRAMTAYPEKQVNEYLRWYYDSHDYIEQGYRNHTVTLLDGTQRNAAEVFYDLLAVTSVMANPTTNLGRSLMGFSNLSDFMSGNHDAFLAAQALMDKLESIPADKTGTLNGTELSARFLTPEVRKLTEGTSMSNQPKYNVFDVLAGRLNLETATNADIANLSSFWTNKPKVLSEDMLSRSSVVEMLDAMGNDSPAAENYRAWARQMDAHEGGMAEMHQREYTPITDAEDVYRKKSQADGDWANMGDAKEVSPGQYEEDAQLGGEWLKDKQSRSTPNILGKPDVRNGLINELYDRAQGDWGGGTIDAHTGVRIPDDFHGDKYAVTANLPGTNMHTLSVKVGAPKEEFAAKYAEALKLFKPWLDAEGAHLGVFNNGRGDIEFDPVAIADGADQVEQIGSATHANGGAYHFRSGSGYYVQHVADQYKDADTANAYYNQLADQGPALAQADPGVERARQQALTEYHGSNALAKMRNFRSNLSDPEGSVGVTLDSVIAHTYGFSQNRWAGGDRMGIKSREFREQGNLWSQLAGHDVRAHSLQALVWIDTKLEIGKMNWGRLQAHLDMAQGDLDHIIADAQAGNNVKAAIKAFDPFGNYYDEELSYSKAMQQDRRILKDLNARHSADPTSLSADELSQREELKQQNLMDEMRTSKVMWTAPRPKAEVGKPGAPIKKVDRIHIPFDSGQLTDKIKGEQKYQAKRAAWQKMLAKGQYEDVRKQMISYVNSKRKHVEGDIGSSFAGVGEAAARNPKSRSFQAIKNLREGGGMPPAPDQWGLDGTHGSIEQLNQRLNGKLRGALLLTPDKTGRLTMRMFEGAALDTLAHEGGHLLRHFLPDEMVQRLARNPGYEHLLDATETPEKAAAEEKFVNDLHYYIRQSVRTGQRTGPLADVFEKIAATLEEQHAATLDTAYGRTFNPDIKSFWDNLLQPDVNPATPMDDPLNARAPKPAGTEVKRFRWESENDFARRARQYGETRARIEATQQKANLAARGAARADAAVRKMNIAMTTTPNDVAAEAARLHTHSQALLEKLGRSLDDPTRAQVPREWQPMWDAYKSLREQVKEHPELAEYMDEIPATWTQVLQRAAEHGFEPTYLPDMTWEQAQTRLFGHIQLGKVDAGTETIANSRKANQGILRANLLGDRSIEALAAGTMDATHELYSNEFVNFIEEHWMRPFQSGAEPPEGWVPWDAERQFVLTGTRADKTKIAVGANGIIPVEVARAIKGMSNRYDHWAFHTLSKVTKPWITYNLTLSPKWYLHVAISNIVRATAEGVSIKDWVTAVKKWKAGELEPEVMDHGINTLMRDGNHSLLGSTIAQAKQAEGMRSAIHEVRGRVSKIHDVMDEVSRSAVFEHTLRKNPGNRAMAMTRSYEALVDYGNLSPLERSVIRSAIPFYPFYKGMLKLIMRFPADHPAATGVLMILGKIHREYLQDQMGGKLPDAYQGVANIGGLHNFTILDPFINPVHLIDIHQLSSVLNPFVDVALRDAYNAAQPGTGQKGMDATGHPITEVNPAQAIGAQLAAAPASRLLGDVFTGGDVFKKDPGVAGGVGQYLGVPTTPNVGNIQSAVDKSTGQPQPAANGGSTDQATIDQLVQQALAKVPAKPRQPETQQQRMVRAIVRSRRPPKVRKARVTRARKPRAPRGHTYGTHKHYG